MFMTTKEVDQMDFKEKTKKELWEIKRTLWKLADIHHTDESAANSGLYTFKQIEQLHDLQLRVGELINMMQMIICDEYVFEDGFFENKTGINNNDRGKCWVCGVGNLVWMNDFSFEDFMVEGEGIVSMLTCSNCGAQYEIYNKLDDEDIEEIEGLNEEVQNNGC